MTEPIVAVLEEARAREKEQTLFYRALAAEAETRGREELLERFNDLHADEQHHLSRLTARILELGATPRELSPSTPKLPEHDVWETVARVREEGEVTWYQAAVEGDLDPATKSLLREILESEQHHYRDLGGKWMAA